LLSNVTCDDDFSSPAYNKLSRQDKFNKIWEHVNAERSPYGWYSKLSLLKIFFTSMKESFDVISDNFTSDRKKYIHSVGVVGHTELVTSQDININPYTGIFKGCSHVILRMSCAKQPDETKITATGAEDNFTPGFGIKFLRDGIHSGNTVSMYAVNGQTSWNFFKHEFANHIAPAEGLILKALEKKFSTATKWTAFAGLKDIATYDQEGRDFSNNLKFPYKLIWRPNAELQTRFSDHWTQDFMTQLESLSAGTNLYSLWVMDSPFSDPVEIGQLNLVKQFTRSKFGDKDLFFRHGYMDDDFAFHPDWIENFGTPEFQKAFREKYGFEHP